MRYAVYFTPGPDDPLCLAGARWLGRDAFGRAIAPAAPSSHFTEDEFDDLVRAPARYGFHGTLVAPFRLADGHTVDDLIAELDQFAMRQPGFVVARLAITRIGAFFALTPREPSAPLQSIADALVRRTWPLRAPLYPDEIARRRPERLRPRQRDHLERWGYPYVFDEFRFHMTLTGPVAAHRQARVEKALGAHFADLIERPMAVDRIAVFVELAPGAPFMVEHCLAFNGPAGVNAAVGSRPIPGSMTSGPPGPVRAARLDRRRARGGGARGRLADRR